MLKRYSFKKYFNHFTDSSSVVIQRWGVLDELQTFLTQSVLWTVNFLSTVISVWVNLLCMCWFCMWAYDQIKILLTFPSHGFSHRLWGNCSVGGIKALPIKPVSALQSACVSQHVFIEAPSLDFTVLLNQQTCGEVLDPSHHHPLCCSVWVSLCL